MGVIVFLPIYLFKMYVRSISVSEFPDLTGRTAVGIPESMISRSDRLMERPCGADWLILIT